VGGREILFLRFSAVGGESLYEAAVRVILLICPAFDEPIRSLRIIKLQKRTIKTSMSSDRSAQSVKLVSAQTTPVCPLFHSLFPTPYLRSDSLNPAKVNTGPQQRRLVLRGFIHERRKQAMAQNSPKTFSGMTPEQYAKLAEKARANGIDMSGNRGTASKYGVEMQWDYSPETQQLTLQCLRTPMFVSAATVYAKLQSLVEQSTEKI
jgi:hypothetical protein